MLKQSNFNNNNNKETTTSCWKINNKLNVNANKARERLKRVRERLRASEWDAKTALCTWHPAVNGALQQQQKQQQKCQLTIIIIMLIIIRQRFINTHIHKYLNTQPSYSLTQTKVLKEMEERLKQSKRRSNNYIDCDGDWDCDVESCVWAEMSSIIHTICACVCVSKQMCTCACVCVGA